MSEIDQLQIDELKKRVEEQQKRIENLETYILRLRNTLMLMFPSAKDHF